jgi:hypothetical protein
MPRGWGSRPRIWLAREDDGWAHHDQQRVPGIVGDPAFLGARGGELEPGYVHLLHVAGAEVRPLFGMPVNVEEPELTGAGGGMVAGDRHLQLLGPPGRGQLA